MDSAARGEAACEPSHLGGARRKRGESNALKAASVSGRAISAVAAEGSASSFLRIIHHNSGQRVEK